MVMSGYVLKRNCYNCRTGLQLAELSSIPRSVVDDAKTIAELIQNQIHVIYYNFSINSYNFFHFREISSNARRLYSKEQHFNWQCNLYR